MENGMILLTLTATLTSLATEAVKKTLNIDSKKISLNLLVVIVSVICSLLVSSGYIILCDITVTPKIIVYVVALIVLSALASACGYDKVIQMIKQIDVTKIGTEN